MLRSPGTNNMNIDINMMLMYTVQLDLKYWLPTNRYVAVWSMVDMNQIWFFKQKQGNYYFKTQTFSFFLLLIIRSSPLKAPDATNKMFVVSTCTVSPLSFLVFFSGTFTIVPSRSLSNPYQNKAQQAAAVLYIIYLLY